SEVVHRCGSDRRGGEPGNGEDRVDRAAAQCLDHGDERFSTLTRGEVDGDVASGDVGADDAITAGFKQLLRRLADSARCSGDDIGAFHGDLHWSVCRVQLCSDFEQRLTLLAIMAGVGRRKPALVLNRPQNWERWTPSLRIAAITDGVNSST